jgi:hypothetical protein
MQNTTNRWMSSIVLLAFFAIIAYAGRSSAQASSVVVTNTTSQPVPTTVQGTPNVRSLQGGTWSVYLLGAPTVRINNATSAPVPVSPTAEKNVFQYSNSITLNPGSAYSSQPFYTVPPGKRLILDWVSCLSYANGDNEACNLVTVGSYNGGSAYLAMQSVTLRKTVANVPVHLVVEAGDQVFVNTDRTGFSTSDTTVFTLEGHFVSVP